jgi:hypothetical protein
MESASVRIAELGWEFPLFTCFKMELVWFVKIRPSVWRQTGVGLFFGPSVHLWCKLRLQHVVAGCEGCNNHGRNCRPPILFADKNGFPNQLLGSDGKSLSDTCNRTSSALHLLHMRSTKYGSVGRIDPGS